MKPCSGCKHLVIYHSRGWCREPCVWVRVTDPTTGRTRLDDRYKYGVSFNGNTTEAMRTDGMPCGPEANLWTPNVWLRLWGWITRA